MLQLVLFKIAIEAMGEELLRYNRLYMLNGTIQMCLDSKYNKY